MPDCLTIYAATTNNGKLKEFAECASVSGLQVLALPGLAGMPEPPEDAPDFMGNAEAKAKSYSRLSPGLLLFADDSGLEVDALGGRPGVRSARFADDLGFGAHEASQSPIQPAPLAAATTKASARDERNNLCVLSLLAQSKATSGGPVSRKARFVCSLALARDGEILLRASGAVQGELLDAPLGTDGFGYDPLFLMPSLGRTMAELPRAEKWAVSHRGEAFRDLLKQLRSLRAITTRGEPFAG